MEVMEMYDLIVVGAGPSGSTAARMACKLGLNVLIIDKDRFPRYKPCGGGLSERAISYLDFSLPQDICEKNITGARIHFKDQFIDGHKSYRLGVTVTRAIFDDFLLKKAQEAGVSDIVFQRVLDYQEKDDHVEVGTGNNTYSSKFLIVCAGSQTRLIERLKERDSKDKYWTCLVTEVPAENRVIEAYIQNAPEIELGIVPMGYGWIFPHLGYFSVGIGGLAVHQSNLRGAMMGFLKKNGFQGSYKLRGHLIPLGGMGRNIASSRVLLAGDSAGFVDALTGEGIAYAIRSGQIAARAISEKLENNDLDLAGSYQLKCRGDFGDDLKYSLILAKIMHSRPEIFYGMLVSNAAFLDKFLEVAPGKVTYKSLISWLVPRMPGYILHF
jgi:geranylgeranyl reductase family protein